MRRARIVISLIAALGLTVNLVYGQGNNIDSRLERIAKYVVEKPDKIKEETFPKNVGRIIVSRKLPAGLESFWVDLYCHPQKDSSGYNPASGDVIAFRSGLSVLHRDVGLDGRPDEISPAHWTEEEKDTRHKGYNALIDSLYAHLPKGLLER